MYAASRYYRVVISNLTQDLRTDSVCLRWALDWVASEAGKCHSHGALWRGSEILLSW
jgi:hypothetical protein